MATVSEMLAEAEAAYHELQIGKATSVFVDQNGERVEFVKANAGKLLAYIQRLQSQLAAQPTYASSPARFVF